MTITTEQPTQGNFIVLWTFNGHIWAMECKWEHDKLLEYYEVDDLWRPYKPYHPTPTHYVIP